MSKYQNLRKEFGHNLHVTSVELVLVEDLINGKIEPESESAAKLFTKSVSTANYRPASIRYSYSTQAFPKSRR